MFSKVVGDNVLGGVLVEVIVLGDKDCWLFSESSVCCSVLSSCEIVSFSAFEVRYSVGVGLVVGKVVSGCWVEVANIVVRAVEIVRCFSC